MLENFSFHPINPPSYIVALNPASFNCSAPLYDLPVALPCVQWTINEASFKNFGRPFLLWRKNFKRKNERIWWKTSFSVWEWLITACKWAIGTCKTFCAPKSDKLPSRSRSPKIKDSGSLYAPLKHSTRRKNIGMFQGSFWNYGGWKQISYLDTLHQLWQILLY